MSSIIESLEGILDDLVTELKDSLPEYRVVKFLRYPTSSERFPVALVIPMSGVPVYAGGLAEMDEDADFSIDVVLLTKVPLDYSGSNLLRSLDLVLQKFKTLRFSTSHTWRTLQYKKGFSFTYESDEQWIIQSVQISLVVEK